MSHDKLKPYERYRTKEQEELDAQEELEANKPTLSETIGAPPKVRRKKKK